MCLAYIVSGIIILIMLYYVYITYVQNKESFYPVRWGWRRSQLYDRGNWRPYGHYPAYSGYWKQCPQGNWFATSSLKVDIS